MIKVLIRFSAIVMVILVLVYVLPTPRNPIEETDPSTVLDSIELAERLEDESPSMRVFDISFRPLLEVNTELTQKSHAEEVGNDSDSNPPTTIHPSEQLVSIGLEILNNSDSHHLPRLLGDYRLNLGFDSYAELMIQRGAVFGVIERGMGTLNWMVDVERSDLLPVVSLAGMSRQTRRIESESAVSWATKKANSLKRGRYDVVLLVPQRMEAYLTASLDHAAQSCGHRLIDLRTIRASYLVESGELFLELNRGVLKSGDSVPLNTRIRL